MGAHGAHSLSGLAPKSHLLRAINQRTPPPRGTRSQRRRAAALYSGSSSKNRRAPSARWRSRNR
eukprot:9278212-Pyramimonas_sp.AAC.1